MKNQNNDTHPFWSGYALGMFAGSAMMYAFGTKSGRNLVRKTLRHTESMEDSLEDVLKLIQTNFVTPQKPANPSK